MADKKFIIVQLKKILRELEHEGIIVRKAFLFGSYASNKQHEFSDVDVAIVADEFKGIDFDDVGLMSNVLINYPELLIQTRTYNPEQFKPSKDPFVSEIIRTGVEIKFK